MKIKGLLRSFVISGLAVQIRPWAPLDNKRAISLIALFYILS